MYQLLGPKTITYEAFGAILSRRVNNPRDVRASILPVSVALFVLNLKAHCDDMFIVSSPEAPYIPPLWNSVSRDCDSGDEVFQTGSTDWS